MRHSTIPRKAGYKQKSCFTPILFLAGIPCVTVQTTDGGCCVFPFVYNSKPVNACTTENSHLNYWCGKTANYDRDQDWGYCHSKLSVQFCAFFLLYTITGDNNKFTSKLQCANSMNLNLKQISFSV